MEFTRNQYKALCDTYINDEEIIITGCNFLAQEFETTGKLAKVESAELNEGPNKYKYAIGVTPDTLILEFGKHNNEEKIRTDYSAPFVTDLYSDDMYNFIIKDIKLKKTKEVIYENSDYPALYDWSRETLIQYGKQLLRNDITPANMNSTCQQLSNHIGKPIDVSGNKGVLFIVDSYHKGEILLYILDFTELKEVKIPATAKITAGKSLIKIAEGERKETFQDYLLNQSKRKK